VVFAVPAMPQNEVMAKVNDERLLVYKFPVDLRIKPKSGIAFWPSRLSGNEISS
jgi:hypothetical protein